MNLQSCLHYLVLLASIIIPPITTAQEPMVLEDFDLVLLSSSSTNQQIHLINTTNRLKNKKIELPELQEGNYEQVTLDTSSNTIYWTNGRGVIGYFNVSDEGHGVLYKKAGRDSRIYDLKYSNSKLYWRDSIQAIKSMGINGSNVTTVVTAEETEKIMGLTVDLKTSQLFYTTWQKYSLTNAKIYTLQNNTPHQLTSNLKFPTSLYYQPPYLHWVSTQPGNYFQVERLNVQAPEQTSVVVKQPHQHVSSLAVTCTGLYWTDNDSKRVWEMDRGTGNVPGGKRLGVEVLGEAEDLVWSQVVGVQRECWGIGRVFNLVGDARAAPVSSSTVRTTTPVTSTESASSSSESVEVQGPGIRLCTDSEYACGGSSDVLCVVIGGSKPVCLYQHQQKLQSSPRIQEATTTHPLSSTTKPDQLNTTSNLQPWSPSTWPPEVIIIISVLSTLATVMSLISLYMTIRVRNLNKKPIIRRRVVVSHRTSESGSSTPASVCEMIDIENCCNMNVCETPCYERTLLNPTNPNTSSTCTTSSTQNGTTLISVNSSNSTWGGGCGAKNPGKEDKKCLLSR